jgi:hypothetical protein
VPDSLVNIYVIAYASGVSEEIEADYLKRRGVS